MKTIKLELERCHPSFRVKRWRRALPFFYNPRGLLIHRVRAVTSHLREDGKVKHTSVHFYCGNFQFMRAGCELFAKPGANRLVCARCEAFAQMKGKPSADQLVGRHVHVGRIIAQRTCCDHSN